MLGEVIASGNTARPFLSLLIQTHLLSFRRVDALEANFDVADRKRIPVNDVRNARDHTRGRGVGGECRQLREH
jgi:hypothetical protein